MTVHQSEIDGALRELAINAERRSYSTSQLRERLHEQQGRLDDELRVQQQDAARRLNAQQQCTVEIASLAEAHHVDQKQLPDGAAVPLEQLRSRLSVVRADLNAVHSLQNVELDREQAQGPKRTRLILLVAWAVAGAGGAIAAAVLPSIIIR